MRYALKEAALRDRCVITRKHVHTLIRGNRRASSYTDSLHAVRCELRLTGSSFIPALCQLLKALSVKEFEVS